MVSTKDAYNPYIVTHFRIRTGAGDPDPLPVSPRTAWKELCAQEDAKTNENERDLGRILEQFNNLPIEHQRFCANDMFEPRCMSQEKICRLLVHLYDREKQALVWSLWQLPFNVALDKESTQARTEWKQKLWLEHDLACFMYTIVRFTKIRDNPFERLRLYKLSFTPFDRGENDDKIRQLKELEKMLPENKPLSWPLTDPDASSSSSSRPSST